MSFSRVMMTAGLVLASSAGTAMAAAEEVGAIPTIQQGIVTGLTALLVFGIVVAVLGAKVWPAITKGLDERAAKIRNEIEAAEMAQEQAKNALRQYEKNLAEARAEAQKMLEDTKAQQAAMAADLKAKADVELNAMRERARRDIEAAKRAALAEIYAESVNIASEWAGKILQREVNPNDQRRMLEESMGQLENVARG